MCCHVMACGYSPGTMLGGDGGVQRAGPHQESCLAQKVYQDC